MNDKPKINIFNLIVLLFKGALVGFGAIMPGISGGTLCVAFGMYQPIMNLLSHPFKELKKNGLLEKKFLGQTKVLKGEFNESYFTKADKRSLSVIPTGSKKVKIWTNMPEDSYTIKENEDKTKTIEITNPKEFWSMTPFLVIQVD